jgi:glycosyltransferase involved in cell wall biosynthesis
MPSPSVSVIIPVRDAEVLLPTCLEAVEAQTASPAAIIVVVAPSTDATQAAAAGAARTDSRIHLLSNPAGDRGSALNRALATIETDAVAMVDAQSVLAPDYLEQSLKALHATGADVVGGAMRPIGRTWVGRAMAVALTSPFGVGDSQFHFAGEARRVDSVYLGVYRTSVFARVGGYNPALLRTEDDDLNARILDSGGAIWLDPAIQSTYRCRESLGAIWRQYHGYGYWKVALATIRLSALRPRHLIPAAFAVALIGSAGVSALWWRPAFPILVGSYAVAAILATATARGPIRARLAMPLVAATMHLAYGTGTLRGLVRWPRLRRAALSGSDD